MTTLTQLHIYRTMPLATRFFACHIPDAHVAEMYFAYRTGNRTVKMVPQFCSY